MKRQDISFKNIVALMIAMIAVFSSCQKENAVPRDYPRIKDTVVMDISGNGATFSADLYTLGTETLTEHGFVWGVYQGLDVTKDSRVNLGVPDKTGVFTAEVTSGLQNGVSYFVKPFVITDKRVVYGPVAKFKSLGSLALSVMKNETVKAGVEDCLNPNN